MAINGVELEVGQKWLTRGGHEVEVVAGPLPGAVWPFVVRKETATRYSVGWDGFAMSSDCPRDADLVQPLRRDSDHAAPLPTAEPQDSNTVTSAQVNDWIEWHGGECPVGPSTPIEVRLRSGKVVSTVQPGDLLWSHWLVNDGSNIVAYRVVKPALFHGRVTVDGEHPGPLQTMVREAMSGIRFASPSEVRAEQGIGDVNSDAKGSGARYNTDKPALELIPLSIVVPFFQHDESLTDAQLRALRALDALGMFQAREGGVYEVLRELGDHWEGCARVFDYGRRKYAEWNWAKGMKWSVPIGCAARHLMAIIRGETHDPESGKPHEWHVYCNVVMLLTYASTFTEGDDRPARGMLL